MNSPLPQFGFDRFIQLDWATVALQVRAGTATIESLTELLNASLSGPFATRKTRTVLNRLWLNPFPNLVEFSDRGVQMYRRAPETSVVALTWGMTLASYPYFGRTAGIVGRLTALQGDCTASEVHRRMAEVYGERVATHRVTDRILQSLENWETIEKPKKERKIVRKAPICLDGSAVVPWLIEACIRHTNRSLPIVNLEQSPLIFPFRIGGSLPYLLSGCETLEISVDSMGNQIVGISD